MPWSTLLRKYFAGLSSEKLMAKEQLLVSKPQESALLSRLPPEIRLQIWHEVVGGNLFHITITHSRPHKTALRCYVCRAFYRDLVPPKNRTPSSEDAYPRCQGSQQEPCFFLGPDEPFGALSLLLSCRQIYNEAVHMLYVANTFNIDNLGILRLVVKTIGPRIRSISNIHVSTAMWRIHCQEMTRLSDEAFSEWKEFWQLLAEKVSGLRHLRLDIYGTSHAGLGKCDLEPLLQFRGLESFDLALWQDTKHHALPGQGAELVGPMQTLIRSHACEGRYAA
ncbi:MAG: hypothetical protein LQ345_006591 [Seirophora villosa]|nr:MAG: hypothetical protein LQ345_006591 [Seirophora villosa]